MVQNNKILTVSYGTFSCTLEGFEDSFETMKAIAEYFRDLAADDRFFGAEPPQPDADMMARIAEREISRQVRARRDGSGIILRASDYQMPAAVAAAAVASATAPKPQAAAAQDAAEDPEEVEPAAEPAAQDDQLADDAQPAAAEHAAPEVEEDAAEAPAAAQAEAPDQDGLAAIRGLMAASDQEHATADAEVEADEVPAAAAEVEELEEVEDLEDTAEAEVEAEAEAEPEIEVEVEVESFTAEITVEEEPADIVAEAPAVDPAPRLAAESIAAKLQRIRAVVSQNAGAEQPEQVEDAADDLAEDQDAVEQEAEAFVTSAAADISAVLEAEDAAENIAEDDEAGADDLAAAFARFDAPRDTADSDSFDETYEETYDDAGTAQPGDVLAVLAAMRDDHAEPQMAEEDTAPSDDLGAADDDMTEAAGIEAEADQFTGGDASDTPEDDDALIEAAEAEEDDFSLSPELFAEMDAAEDDGDDEMSNLLGDDTASDAEDSDSSLSAEDEADLMRELAEVAAETEADDDDSAGFAPEGTDEDVSRLMAAAEEKMEAVESATNRETYNHLRAAVAAAEAERSAGGDVDDADGDTAYRKDLASVVHPRRSLGDGSRPTRPERPAPLKLVAEQRVDLEKPETPAEPVQPRRVQVSDTAETGDEGGFAKFASEVGATDLHELLEAAAAYLSFVEGHDQFSRPQLMNKVRQLGIPEFNREDGLRSFGQLLREGKIEKAGGGRFTASGDIGFRPDERAAG